MSSILSEGAQTIILQEKWNGFLKKMPFSFRLCFYLLMGVFIFFLFCFIADFFSEKKSFDLFVVLFILAILIIFVRPLLSRRRYEVIADGENFIVKRNGKEIFNVLGKHLSFVVFNERPFVGIDSLKIDYKDEFERTRFFYIPLRYIPYNECQQLQRHVYSFFNKYANNRKTSGETNWGKALPITAIITILMETLCYFIYSETEEKSILVLLFALFFAGLLVYVGIKYQ